MICPCDIGFTCPYKAYYPCATTEIEGEYACPLVKIPSNLYCFLSGD